MDAYGLVQWGLSVAEGVQTEEPPAKRSERSRFKCVVLFELGASVPQGGGTAAAQ